MKPIKSKILTTFLLVCSAIALLQMGDCPELTDSKCKNKDTVDYSALISDTDRFCKYSTNDANKDCHAYYTIEYGMVE